MRKITQVYKFFRIGAKQCNARQQSLKTAGNYSEKVLGAAVSKLQIAE